MDGDKKEKDRKRLDHYNKELDLMDEQLASLLSARLELAGKIARLKRSLGVESFDLSAEQSRSQALRSIFSEIRSASRDVREGLSVAYLGPEGTFSHRAALCMFGGSASFRASESIGEVFGLVEKGVCRQGVVPIENSYAGQVDITSDLFYQFDLRICAEIFMRIRHHLLSKSGCMGDIKRLYSHPMPVAQCRSWLKANLRGIPVLETASTSLAAKKAAHDPEGAALGSRFSGETYGLIPVEENIEDDPENITRFLVIGKNRSKPTGKDKTSVLFFLKNSPGSLNRCLTILAERGVNVKRIDSRPMKNIKWEYLFFLDMEGHEEEKNMGEALHEMERHSVFMKRLGSYPAGGEPWD